MKLLRESIVTIFFMLPFFASACTFTNASGINNPRDLDLWIANEVERGEVVLCKRQVEGDDFFVAQKQSGERIKVGARIEVTGDHSEPKAFTLGWLFQDERNEYLATNSPPIQVKQEYVKTHGKWYAEHIQYQTLRLSDARQLRITVDFNKCGRKDDCPLKGANSRTVELCVVPLGPKL